MSNYSNGSATTLGKAPKVWLSQSNVALITVQSRSQETQKAGDDK